MGSRVSRASSPSRRSGAALVALVVTAAAPVAAAQPQSTEPDELLRQGVELRRKHADAEALEVFRHSYELRSSGIARAQIALAEQALGQWVRAMRDIDAALAETDDAWIQRNHEALTTARSTIAEHVAFLHVVVSVPTSVVQLDGEALVAGVEQPVPAGSHVLETVSRGYAPDIRQISLAPGAHVKTEITLSELALESRPPSIPVLDVQTLPPTLAPLSTAPPPPRARPIPWGPIVTVGAGIVAVGIGSYFGIRAIHDRSLVSGECDPTCTAASVERARTDYSDEQFATTGADIAFGAGLALVAGGVTWWLLQKSSWKVAPGPTVAGATVVGAW